MRISAQWAGEDEQPRPTPLFDRARLRLTRLRLVVILTAILGLAQIFFEDVVLFIATTQDGVSGVLSSPLIAIGVPLTIATLLILLLVGGALWVNDHPEKSTMDLDLEGDKHEIRNDEQ